METTPEAPETTSTGRKRGALIAGGAAGLVVVLIAAFLVVAYLDPFGWDLFGRRPAEYAATSIPPDVALYMSVDLAEITCEELNPIVWAFSEELRQEGKCALDEMFASLDEDMQESLDLTFTEDIKPWIGRSMAIGLSEIDIDLYGDFEDMSLIMAVEARDVGAADDFLPKFVQAVAEEEGVEPVEETYKDVTLYKVALDGSQDTPPLVVARSEGMVLLGMGMEEVKAAIDAQGGESLAESAHFQESVAALPQERMFTLFMDAGKYLDLTWGIFGELYGQETGDLYAQMMEEAPNVAGGLRIVEAGIQMDLVALYDPEKIPQALHDHTEFLEQGAHTLELMPEDTFMVFVGTGMDLGVEQMRENLASMPGGEDFEESLDMFELSFGFNPFDDLFARLDGEWAFTLLPSSKGIFAEQLDVSMGFAFLAETSDPDAIEKVVEDFSTSMEGQGFGEVEKSQEGALTLYQLVDMFSGEALFTYGVGEGYFLLGTSGDLLGGLFDGGPSLTQSQRYQRVQEALPADMHPSFYLDLEQMLATIREGMPEAARQSFDEEMEKVWKPIQFFAIGAAPLQERMMKSAVILIIEKYTVPES